MLFYSCRKKTNQITKTRRKIDPKTKELTDTLQTMGLDISYKQVQQGLIELYPDGTDSQEQGVVIRGLFRHFKSK